jgi:alkylated DNA nucleotide flippase Atl1
MVHAVETNLQRLLEGTKQYQVPLYQRTYSWKTDQLQRLWDDLVKLAVDRFERGPAATHFIGSLVLAPSPAIGPTGLQEFLVVDGQQRLTTVTLLLTAIRDHRADTEAPSHFDRINETYLMNKWEAGQPTKLLPTQSDRPAYLACVHRTAHAGGADPVGAAYRFFRSRLMELDDPDDPLDIQRVEEAVIAGLSLVCVTAQSGDNVHRIFESLNNTGLRLTQGDLIRNYLFMRLPTRGEHVYKSVWLPLQERLDSNQLETLFWLDLVQSDDTAKQTDTYALQQSRMDALLTETEIEAEVSRLARLGALLSLMLDPTHEPDRDVRRQLERLNAWGTTTAYPILLHLLERRADHSASSAEIAAAMRYLESFFVRRLVAGHATKNLNRILLAAVQAIKGKSPLDEALRDYLSAGRKFFATDTELREAVRTVPFYWSGKASQKNLVLRWLEESYASKEQVNADGLTIEHVLPQTLSDEWRSELDDTLQLGEDLDSIYQGLLHTIGNLTLTGYNAELSNSTFDTKKIRLASSGLRMNQEIAQNARWGRDEIQQRAERLAERIITTWPGPNPTVVDPSMTELWTKLANVLAEIPAGAWTTYRDVATVIGTHPVPVGQRLANHPVPNAHRVLSVTGAVAPTFRWLDPQRTDTARDVLEQEGVTFDDGGRANPAQQLTAEDLAILSGLDTGDDPNGRDRADEAAPTEGQAARFLQQLRTHQSPQVVDAVTTMLDAWVHLGGTFNYGHADETSCFVVTHTSARSPWPFTIYPSGRVEIVFQHMASRPPFDDVDLRHQFRERLDAIAGIDVPTSKIELRPSFQLSVLADTAARDAVIEELAWYLRQVSDHARQSLPRAT